MLLATGSIALVLELEPPSETEKAVVCVHLKRGELKLGSLCRFAWENWQISGWTPRCSSSPLQVGAWSMGKFVPSPDPRANNEIKAGHA